MYVCGNTQVTPDARAAQAHVQTALSICFSFSVVTAEDCGLAALYKGCINEGVRTTLQKAEFIVPGFQSMHSHLF